MICHIFNKDNLKITLQIKELRPRKIKQRPPRELVVGPLLGLRCVTTSWHIPIPVFRLNQVFEILTADIYWLLNTKYYANQVL